jgi:hypothetical protein
LDKAVKFMSHGAGYDLFLTANETVLRVHKPRGQQVDKLKDLSRTNTASDENVREGTVLRLKLLGASSSPEVAGQNELPGKVNYFIGNDPAEWRRNVPTYRKAYFKQVLSRNRRRVLRSAARVRVRLRCGCRRKS